MEGLLNFIQSPAGIGLLSAAAGGMATARRGTPWNNFGRGAVAGLTGYSLAKDQIRKADEDKLAKQYKQLQMDQIQQTLADSKARRDWAAGFPGVVAGKPTGSTEQGQQLVQQQADFGQEGLESLKESAQYVDAPLNVSNAGADPQAVREYMMRPGSPYAQDLIKEQFVPKKPKWNVAERYNELTGMKEKVLMDENNPSDIRPFGGTQADTIVADNLGGSLSYRGAHSVNPLGQMQRTVSPDSQLSAATSRRGQDISSANAAAARAISIRGQDMGALSANKKGMMDGWKYDAGSDEWVSPPSAEFPFGRRSGNKAKMGATKSMDYVIGQFRGGTDKNGKPQPGVLEKATTGGFLGVRGQIGRVLDSQDAFRFNNLKEQMSTELRTLFRIPGEGALSDKEQAQYGLQLPDLRYSKKTNEAILGDIEARTRLRNNLDANPYAQPAPAGNMNANQRSGGVKFMGFE